MSKFPKLLNDEGRDLCLKCHVRVGMEIDTKSVVHARCWAIPASAMIRTPPTSRACCSRPRPPSSAPNATRTCTGGAHPGQQPSTPPSPPSAAAPTATSPTRATNASLLEDEPKNLCFECHNQPIELPDGTKLVNMKKVIDSGKSLHSTVARAGASSATDIHGGDHRHLLNDEYPSDMYYPFSESSYALCFSCHDRHLVLDQKTSGATGFRNGEMNLHFVHVSITRAAPAASATTPTP